MTYIITQSEHNTVEDLSEIDTMIEETSAKIKIFASRKEAELYLMEDGLFPEGGVFPYNIRVQRMQ